MAGLVLALMILGMEPAKEGSMREVGPGKLATASLSMTIHPVHEFTGRVKFPVKVAVWSSFRVSPQVAALIRACKLSPAFTRAVVPVCVGKVVAMTVRGSSAGRAGSE